MALIGPGLILACGCEIAFREETPVCGFHGPQRVVRTVRMPPPKIRGVASGPHVSTEDLPAWTARITGTEPVKDS
jgi:hypothetical protein